MLGSLNVEIVQYYVCPHPIALQNTIWLSEKQPICFRTSAQSRSGTGMLLLGLEK